MPFDQGEILFELRSRGMLPGESQTWRNRWLIASMVGFGYGFCMYLLFSGPV